MTPSGSTGSPSTAGSSRLALARSLWFNLPSTLTALRRGQVSEWVATLISRETAHLDAATRRAVDAQLAQHDLPTVSPRRAAATTQALAYRADPAAAVARAHTEEKARRVTLRPAPDTMAILTAHLPAPQAIAAWAALSQQANSAVATGDGPTRGQIMADTLVTRVTGQVRPNDPHVEIGLVMPIETLAHPDAGLPTQLLGYGPLPAALARELLHHTRGELFVRRLHTTSGHIVASDKRRRRFPRALARAICYRDRHCRDPYCDAPIRHLDHIQRYADSGPTSVRPPVQAVVEQRDPPARRLAGVVTAGADPSTVGKGQRHHPAGHTYTSQAPQSP